MNVEFVSANPTGPITVASGRHAAYGDSLARILERAGHRVEREYYVNDAGGQVQRFGESIRARARGEEPPEDGYRGDYVTELAGRDRRGGRRGRGRAGRAGRRADARGREGARSGASACEMDRYFSERELHAGGRRGVLERLGDVYEHEGAHLAAHHRARRRQGPRAAALERRAAPTSRSDIAYHADKLARAYDRAIDVLGRRPPRPHQADEDRLGARSAATRTPTRS